MDVRRAVLPHTTPCVEEHCSYSTCISHADCMCEVRAAQGLVAPSLICTTHVHHHTRAICLRQTFCLAAGPPDLSVSAVHLELPGKHHGAHHGQSKHVGGLVAGAGLQLPPVSCVSYRMQPAHQLPGQACGLTPSSCTSSPACAWRACCRARRTWSPDFLAALQPSDWVFPQSCLADHAQLLVCRLVSHRPAAHE